MPRPTRERRGLHGEDQGDRRAVRASALARSRRSSAGWSRAKAPSAISPRDFGLKSSTSGRSTPTSRARRSRCARSSTRCARTRSRWSSARAPCRDKPAKQVARETGARYGGVLYVDSLSDANGPVPTYLDLLRYRRNHRQGIAGMNAPLESRDDRRAALRCVDRRARRHRHLPQRPHRAARRHLRNSARGTISALVGVNGSGKSTLFKAIMGFVRAARGRGDALLGMPRSGGAEAQRSSPMCRRARTSTGTFPCWSRTW